MADVPLITRCSKSSFCWHSETWSQVKVTRSLQRSWC